ncbi:MAG: TRAP transporter large permease [Gammaproteobacteria bacterium]|nr:MAG: TRAP transporter large permease [Gammaproteobacteria bacterium]
MTETAVGVLGLGSLFTLLAIRMPVALSMLLVGLVGTIVINGMIPGLSSMSGEAMQVATEYNLIVIPLFILMGNLAGISGMSTDLFAAAYSWMGHRKGGLASATVAACAGFAALSGSSLASAVTMGRVALPEMKRFNYANSLSTGAVAAGGTLGFLIPPSGGMIIYAILTEQSIGRLFMAGILPGIILTLLFIGAIWYTTFRNPEAGPAGPRASRQERVQSLVRALPILGVVTVTIGGMYSGVFTPVEAAGVGAFLMMLMSAWRRALSLKNLEKVILDTLKTTSTVFLILIGAFVFIPFMALTEVPSNLVTFLTALPIGEYGILLLIVLTYMLLGTFLEGIAMLVLTLPVVMPLVANMGWDPIWFGIIIVIVLEMGMISPPVGINVFIVKGIAPDVPMGQIFRGIWPFWFAMALMILLLVLVPEIATYIPDTMMGT